MWFSFEMRDRNAETVQFITNSKDNTILLNDCVSSRVRKSQTFILLSAIEQTILRKDFEKFWKGNSKSNFNSKSQELMFA